MGTGGLKAEREIDQGTVRERNPKIELLQEHSSFLQRSEMAGEDGGKKKHLRMQTAPEICTHV